MLSSIKNNSVSSPNCKSRNENILESDLHVLCKKDNNVKIKELLNDLYNLNSNLSKEFQVYFNSVSEIPENIKQEIADIFKKHFSFFNIIYFNIFKKKLDLDSSAENTNITENYLVEKLLAFSHILERLSDLLSNDIHNKYIIEMLIDSNKLLSLLTLYGKEISNDKT